MKLSFSTRGWPGLNWENMIETALDMGFTGIEVYNLPKFDPLLEKGGPFHKHNIAAAGFKIGNPLLRHLRGSVKRQQLRGCLEKFDAGSPRRACPLCGSLRFGR